MITMMTYMNTSMQRGRKHVIKYNPFHIKILLLTVFITSFFLNFITPITEVHASQDSDSFLYNYLDENITDSEIITNRVIIHAEKINNSINKKSETITDHIHFSVQTFKSSDSSEFSYHTIIDYHFIEPMKVKNNDRLTVTIGSYLRPVSPITSVMLSKAKQDEEWQIVKEPVPVMSSLQSFTIEGSELLNSDQYSRIVIHIPSYSNPEVTEDELPEYAIEYTRDPSIYMDFSNVQLLLVGAAVIILASYIFKKLNLL